MAKSARNHIMVLQRRLKWLREHSRKDNHFAAAEASAIEWAILNTEAIAVREETSAKGSR